MGNREHPPHHFLRRLARQTVIALCVLGTSLGLGVWGYGYFEGLTPIDSLLNASMILGGMGPVNPVLTTGGKLFASFYAIFSGVIFLAVMGIMFGPIAHRALHTFHVDDRDVSREEETPR